MKIVTVVGARPQFIKAAAVSREIAKHPDINEIIFNMKMPEEINRILTDRISDILCCPTDKAVENLKQEGFEHLPCQVVKTGDVMQDAAQHYREISATRSHIIHRLKLAGKDFLLCTIHRAENTDDLGRLTSIIDALNEISSEMEIVLPLHPRTTKIVESKNIQMKFKPILPVSYFDMIELLKNTRIVLTDSGGVQKEAFFFAKPCVTLRDETEWVELVDKGFNRLAGAEKDKIINAYNEMKDKQFDFKVDLYGSGRASKNIIETILEKSGSSLKFED